MWQFLCGENHIIDDARIVSLKYVFDLDNSIGKLKGMTCGCYATRESKEDKWTVSKRNE